MFHSLVWRFWDFLFVFVVSLEADEIDSEDSTEPPHKRLCLSSEDDQSIDDSTPCISVVALPRKSLYINRVPFWNQILAYKRLNWHSKVDLDSLFFSLFSQKSSF